MNNDELRGLLHTYLDDIDDLSGRLRDNDIKQILRYADLIEQAARAEGAREALQRVGMKDVPIKIDLIIAKIDKALKELNQKTEEQQK